MPESKGSLSDEAVLAACRGGDQSAWEALVIRYQRLVYAVPRRAGLDQDGAADVFQDVFATLVENIRAIEQPARLRAWLVTTARFKTWRAVRGVRASRLSDGGEDALLAVPDAAMPPDEALEQLEEQHAVRAAVAALDDRCRELITLLFYRPEPPPYSEVAAALGMPEGGVGPTRARCLRKLLRLLDGREPRSAGTMRQDEG